MFPYENENKLIFQIKIFTINMHWTFFFILSVLLFKIFRHLMSVLFKISIKATQYIREYIILGNQSTGSIFSYLNCKKNKTIQVKSKNKYS